MRFLILCVSTVALAVSAADAVAQNPTVRHRDVLFIAVNELHPKLRETTQSRVAKPTVLPCPLAVTSMPFSFLCHRDTANARLPSSGKACPEREPVHPMRERVRWLRKELSRLWC